jgi:HAD superfamily hydrolase (TIGR01549 family)
MIEPAPSLVLFDLDDTLCDYAAARRIRLRDAFTAALAHAPGGADGIDLDRMIDESIKRHPHGSEHFGELLREYGVDNEEITQEVRRWFHANRFLGLELFPDAIATLRVIRAALPGRRIGLITNGPDEIQTDKIALLELGPLVDFAIISGRFGVAKPDPAIFAEGLRLGNATAEETVFVGDSPEYDIVGAQASGIRAIWVNRTGLPWLPNAAAPACTVTSLTELAHCLGALRD